MYSAINRWRDLAMTITLAWPAGYAAGIGWLAWTGMASVVVFLALSAVRTWLVRRALRGMVAEHKEADA